MKDFVFISDFDGTLTEKDFYKIITDTYLKEKAEPLYKAWRNKEIKDVDYLGFVFKNIDRNETDILKDIMGISFDPYAKEFIENIRAAKGDFIIVSAGTSYYIDKILAEYNIENVEVYSNAGIFKENGIHFNIDSKSEYYSEIYGIDKFLVVKKLKEKYKKVFYAGDSGPDLKAALIADVVFARGELIDMLEANKKEYIKFNNFSEIWDNLKIHLKER